MKLEDVDYERKIFYRRVGKDSVIPFKSKIELIVNNHNVLLVAYCKDVKMYIEYYTGLGLNKYRQKNKKIAKEFIINNFNDICEMMIKAISKGLPSDIIYKVEIEKKFKVIEI